MNFVKPYFSIVIPTYNRPQSLAACLASLEKLDYPRNRFEVIVVDDGSEVSLNDTITPFHESLNLTLITQANTGPATARNTGCKVAKGTILAFTDDDCQPAANWLSSLELYFIGDSQVPEIPYAVGGQIYNSLSKNYYSIASQSLIDYLYEHYNAEPRNSGFFTSNNLAVFATDFRAIGGFNEKFPLAAAEDREFCNRWRTEGYRLIYAPKVVVHHAHKLTLKSFWRQQFNYGRGAFHFYQRQEQRSLQQPQRQPWTFYLSLLYYPFRQFPLPRSLTIALLFLVSQVAVVMGFMTEARR